MPSRGAAEGYGLDLALGCDIRLMSDKAKMLPGFAKRGVVPESGGTWFLPRLERIAWRTDRYKYIHDASTGPQGIGELYDWTRDPSETQNLASQDPEVVKQLRAELFEFYFDLRHRASEMSRNGPVDLSPTRIRQLKSLGYIQ